MPLPVPNRMARSSAVVNAAGPNARSRSWWRSAGTPVGAGVGTYPSQRADGSYASHYHAVGNALTLISPGRDSPTPRRGSPAPHSGAFARTVGQVCWMAFEPPNTDQAVASSHGTHYSSPSQRLPPRHSSDGYRRDHWRSTGNGAGIGDSFPRDRTARACHIPGVVSAREPAPLRACDGRAPLLLVGGR